MAVRPRREGPTPEEVGAMYDTHGEMLSMLLGGSAVHIGMYVPDEAPAPVTDLVALSDAAQDRQTASLIEILSLGPRDHLLDIGCGTGGPAVELALRSGARVTGVTVSTEQLARCEERAQDADVAGRVRFAHGNAMDLALPDGSFDAAWSIDCFPHLTDRAAALREAARVLRPGGRLLATDFTDRSTPPPELVDAYRRLWSSPAPTAFDALLADVRESGLELVRVWNRTSNVALAGELMHAVFQDRRQEMAELYGAEAVEDTAELIAPFRAYCRDHLDYYQLLLRRPA
ncbi:SAM-dependent methyltransferase [Streptomyces xiaopingdaonensis]|uniref:SAM-dependent methyltransferase n=1 Tax=Streptomyces xiaopingdaonensis TaxID=1565415 RepID=UPI0002E91498|nr:methyltransferase domain-containing protein [Streptomyces xiaopingdaonensis]